MRILIITGIFPPDIGGPATYVPQIAQGLVERGHQICVVTLSDDLNHDDRKYPFRVVRLPRQRSKPLRQLCVISTIIRLGWHADVLFVNGLALESVIANFLLRKPLVMKVVGDLAWERATNWGWTNDNFEVFQQRRYGIKIEVLKTLRSWWTRKAHRVIVPSRYLAHWVARWGVPEERIEVVYNALEPMDGIKPVPVPLQTPMKAITVGRLIPLKRVEGILEAVAQIPELGLVVVGDGPERVRLERMATSLGISERVYFAGQRSREETLSLMAACDIFVLNSTHEGLPHVVMEAMSLGLLVVATAVGGTPEVVKHGETGLPISQNDALPAVLDRLVKDANLRILMGQKARQWVGNHLNLKSMVERTEEIMNKVINRVTFLLANFPYTSDVSDPKAWAFIEKKAERDFPWLFSEGYPIILSGLGKGWRGMRRNGQVLSHAIWVSTGKRWLDAVLAWITHIVDALKALRRSCIIGIAPTPEAGLGLALARTICKRMRLVVRVQGHTASKALFVHRSKWRFKLLEGIESFVLKRADLVHPMGKFTQELAIRYAVRQEKIVLLPFPVRWKNSATVTPLPPQPCILFVGRLEKEKGVHILLEAMRIVQNQIPYVELLIAGDGSYRQDLEYMVEMLGLGGHVSFLGWLEEIDLQHAYQRAWVLVLPSIWAEGLGMVLIEAGLMGRPVIGSDLGGIRDVIQHGYNGFLVSPGDSKGLAEAIITILRNRDLAQQMGQANIEVAREYLEVRDKALEEVRQAVLALVEK